MSKFSQKGVSLYLAIAIMTALLAIVLGVTGILVSQLRMIRGMEDSVIAFFAADTGNERGLKAVLVEGALPGAIYNGLLDIDASNIDARYTVNVLPTSDCPGAEYYCIKSVGYYKETSRAIETQR